MRELGWATSIAMALLLGGVVQGAPLPQDALQSAPIDSTCAAKARSFTLGQPISADLKNPDGLQSQATPFTVFETTLDADAQLSILVKGDGSFLPVVTIGRCEAGVFTRLGVGSASSVTLAEALTKTVETGLTIREPGSYRIRITGADQRVGRATLLADKVTLQAKPEITELSVNNAMVGQLTINSNRLVFDDTHLDASLGDARRQEGKTLDCDGFLCRGPMAGLLRRSSILALEHQDFAGPAGRQRALLPGSRAFERRRPV
jgi:hypothetical protein